MTRKAGKKRGGLEYTPQAFPGAHAPDGPAPELEDRLVTMGLAEPTSDEGWKQRAIAQDMEGFAERARKRGDSVKIVRRPGVSVITVVPNTIVGKWQEEAPRKDLPRDWDELAPRIVPEQILPWFMRILRVAGQSELFVTVLRVKEYRPDLLDKINEAVEQLGLTRKMQAAEMRFLDRLWKKEILPRIKAEHMPQLAEAAHAKGPAIVGIWIERLRRHKPALLQAFLDALQAKE